MYVAALILMAAAFEAGQAAGLRQWPLMAVCVVPTLICLWWLFLGLDRLHERADRRRRHDPSRGLSRVAERDGQAQLAREAAHGNGGRRGAEEP